ncbi:hypothetical protein TVAG_427670 [Trichomonas vaginalis G3]|uniref:Uncharacterized protein n=1 Tax=Trichomonas vaginalis (strain ATCC PRA-98 / G3) TaxID=412133 RepID=A2F686_TRIV3|nr:hypothetical protein TVAGG3_0660170 [Trichomonas vaginalis G3]EAX99603.1 hypothetical protein TVAG_427670 [Trichomonas vaginalis G3]KAI5506440.1 hypothetical protein TVAGG3_0660170 [Trichomonas vaginalis G3]|eukprot:XP_001312533.1 hypothetical protein [Trichomonas vaginalis G3]
MFDPKLIKDIIQTRSVNKHKRKTSQSKRDYEKIKNRISQAGIQMDYVAAYLEKLYGDHMTVTNLLSLATKIAQKLDLNIDRLAKRNRSALICWFAENWKIVYPYLPIFAASELVKISTLNINTLSSIKPMSIAPSSSFHIDITDVSQLLNNH